MMNDQLESGFIQEEVIKIFCDICKALSKLHHCQIPIIHRDLKVNKQLITHKKIIVNKYLFVDFIKNVNKCILFYSFPFR